jgi:hypothetical protein
MLRPEFESAGVPGPLEVPILQGRLSDHLGEVETEPLSIRLSIFSPRLRLTEWTGWTTLTS